MDNVFLMLSKKSTFCFNELFKRFGCKTLYKLHEQVFALYIRKTCHCYTHPLKPQLLYSETGVYRGTHACFFLFVIQNIDCGYSLEPPR